MARLTVTGQMTKRCQELAHALIRRAKSKCALSRALGCSPTQIGHLTAGRRQLTLATQASIAEYLSIPAELVESYYMTGEPTLKELLSTPKLTGRMDLQTAIECLNEAPALVKIEQGLQLLHMGLAERDLGVEIPAMPTGLCSYKAFTDYFNESVAANTRVKQAHQAKTLGMTIERFQQLLSGEVAPTVEEIGRIATYYPDPEGDLDNAEYWGGLAFPHLMQPRPQTERATHPEMVAP